MQDLLDALIDSWDRNNRILVNLLRILPPGALELRGSDDGMSIARLFAHMHYVREVFVEEDAPEFLDHPVGDESVADFDIDRVAAKLDASAKLVADAVVGRLQAGRPMDLHYDHPILLLQHMIWHEGYHHGQIKLILKQAGMAIDNEVAGPGTWSVWMEKTSSTT